MLGSRNGTIGGRSLLKVCSEREVLPLEATAAVAAAAPEEEDAVKLFEDIVNARVVRAVEAVNLVL